MNVGVQDYLRYRVELSGLALFSPLCLGSQAIEALSGRHKGERAFVLGTAPTLLEINLKALENEITFGVNRIVQALVPRYYVAIDGGSFVHTPFFPLRHKEEHRKDWVARVDSSFNSPSILSEAFKSELIFVEYNNTWEYMNAVAKEDALSFPSHKIVFYFADVTGIGLDCPLLVEFSESPVCVRNGSSCIFPALQFAYAMGCDPIYIAGVTFKAKGEYLHFYPDNVLEEARKRGSDWGWDVRAADKVMRALCAQAKKDGRTILSVTSDDLMVERGILKSVKLDSLGL